MEPNTAFADLLPSFADDKSSVTTTKAFQFLYRDESALQHFKATKKELPLQQIVQNKEFLTAIAQCEPGLKIDYDLLETTLSRLKACPEYQLDRLFDTFTQFLKTHDYAVAIAARFISFDLHLNMLRSYWQPNYDIAFLKLVPTTTPEELQEYVEQAEQFNGSTCQKALFQNWRTYRQNAQDAFTHFATLKDTPAITDTINDLNRLAFICDQSEALRREAARLEVLEAKNKKLLRVLHAKTANQATSKAQLGQAGRHRLRTTMVDAVIRYNNEKNVSLINGGMGPEGVAAQVAKNGWTSHPDTWEGMNSNADEQMTSSDDTDNTSASFSSQGSA